MKSLSDIRTERLMTWIADEFQGNVAAFRRHHALKASMDSYIYQIVAGNRSFGERAARKLEQATGRPQGWLDGDAAPTGEPEVLTYDRRRVAKLPQAERQLIEDYIKLVLAKNEKASRGGVRVGVPTAAAPSDTAARPKPKKVAKAVPAKKATAGKKT